MIDLLTPWLLRMGRTGQARGEAECVFDLVLCGGLSPELGAEDLGVSLSDLLAGAFAWERGGRNDSDLDDFLEKMSLMP